ncbi:MAG TPA: HAD family phosphatase [Thermoplasmata archaeon]|nr:HAD family phosphatase [Thermoplasmata archaeon]
MASIRLLLWDIGGVLLSNGWDRPSREAAVHSFGLDGTEFERRHAEVELAFERGQLDWDQYLDATVFYLPRAFSKEAIQGFVEARSTAIAPNLELAKSLRARRIWRMAALNNESRPLNEYRIQKFGLRDVFDVFFSSGFTGLRKPDPAAYRYALELTQRSPEETVFLDDRPENVAAAVALGLRTILVRDPVQVRNDLADVGVAAS